MTDTVAPAPPPSDPAPAGPPAPAAAAPPPPRKRVLFSVVLAIAAIVGVVLVLWAWRLPPFASGVQHTDNAYVRGQVTVIAPQVTGYVTSVEVQDFQTVKAGDLLATIDDRIYRQRLEQARAALHSAQAALANSTQTQTSARGSVAQTNASIAGARAAVAKAQADHDRARTLYEGGWVAQAQVDVTRTALQAAQAQLAAARAAEGIAETGVTSAVVSRGTLEAAVENAQAQVHLAEIDLANTRITAPRDGRLGEISVRQGQQVAVGTQLMALVPDRIWVTANFKENQLKDIRVGQKVELAVDALGGQVLTGRVEQIAPATGSEFSVIRPDNATGNFTKVAQRVPVRIALDPGQDGLDRLRPGLSVTARVDTRGD
ncbi:HlyD family secretion protein [Brevundimonas lenta]|uniref:Multidrug resistance efflux pump n=1 Tax=Brevundimonas lenta TaxID=424796 RepID=A0A7W6JDH9_9CAUL|nr:HlyD family secretion protein [Brevundimonas lenta]MBB4082141.1 multidrug resistance efflux pump [Brevundimonas lenta]